MNTQEKYKDWIVRIEENQKQTQVLNNELEKLHEEHLQYAKYKVGDIFGYRKEDLEVIYLRVVFCTSVTRDDSLTITYRFRQCRKDGSCSKYAKFGQLNEVQIEHLSKYDLIWIRKDAKTTPPPITDEARDKEVSRRIKTKRLDYFVFYYISL